MLVQYTYVSSAVSHFNAHALRGLLDHARRRNEAAGLTGLLLFHDGNFLQVVEGTPEAVGELKTRLAKDPRHRGILELLWRTIEQREFSEWSMGFRDLNDPALAGTPGFSQFMNLAAHERSLPETAGRVQALLKSFRASFH